MGARQVARSGQAWTAGGRIPRTMGAVGLIPRATPPIHLGNATRWEWPP